MNFALSDEQEFLKEAARGSLGRFATLEAAREALDGGELPDLWPTACEAGWPGLLIAEDRGGAGLHALEAMLVFAELGRALAAIPLLGHLPATFLLDAAGDAHADALGQLAAGETRAAYLPAKPPSDVEAVWTADPRFGHVRRPAPVLADGKVSGELGWVPDAPGASLLVGVAVGEDGHAHAVLIEADADGVEVEAVRRYDATRSLGHVTLQDAPAVELDVEPTQSPSGSGTGESLAAAWYLAQSLLAAESLGAVEVALEASVQYAKERFTFGRAIGSYQAVKHDLVEVLRRLENARSLMYYAGWAGQDKPSEFALAASALRVAAGGALDHASRAQISVHGGIGATWEHDAPLYFRRAQLSRRLLGGTADAADRVAGELLAAAR
jgi:alkylation response protein AidB-like acyl-CoA dehydrogenase